MPVMYIRDCDDGRPTYCRKDKSNIIWDTIIIIFYDKSHYHDDSRSYQVAIKSLIAVVGSGLGDQDLYRTRVKCAHTYLPDLIHLKNSIVVK